MHHKAFVGGKSFSKFERPNVMRPGVVDSYIKSVMDIGAQKVLQEHQERSKEGDVKTMSWVKIIEKIYRLNLDNRILNNLRQ